MREDDEFDAALTPKGTPRKEKKRKEKIRRKKTPSVSYHSYVLFVFNVFNILILDSRHFSSKGSLTLTLTLTLKAFLKQRKSPSLNLPKQSPTG